MGLALVVGGVVLIVSLPGYSTITPLFLGALLLIGTAIMLPKLVQTGARLLRPLLDRFGGATGALATDAMISAPRRSASTVGALVIGTMFVFTTGAAIKGYKHLVFGWMDRMITADLIVASSGDTRSITTHFAEKLGEQLSQIPEIDHVESIRYTDIAYDTDRAALMATDMSGFRDRIVPQIDGSDRDLALRLLESGAGAVVSRNFQARWHSAPGTALSLETPAGTLPLRVVGVVDDYRSELGTVFLSRDVYKQYWHDSAVDFFDVNLRPGAPRVAVRGMVEQLVAGAGDGIVYTNSEYRDRVERIINEYFLLNDAQLFIAVAVALVGITNTLVIAVSERRREIGVLRALGALRNQIRNQVMLESIVAAVIGTLLGALLSLLMTLLVSRTVSNAIAGFSLPFEISWLLMLSSLPVVAGSALMASWWPARLAARVQPVEAIGYE
jgi:putative ABC transport system permease protein